MAAWTCAVCGSVQDAPNKPLQCNTCRSRKVFSATSPSHIRKLIKLSTTHGMDGTPEHRTWTVMKRRCLAKHDDAYPDYGGRGIFVCEPSTAMQD